MSLTKATITNLDTNDSFSVLFNPTEYTLAKTVNWTTKPDQGHNVPKRTFGGGNPQKLDMELFFDVYETEDGDVRDYINKLWKLTMIDESNENSDPKTSRPPLCLFQWGPNWTFKAAVTSLSVRYTLFREDGTPVRATAKIALEEAKDDDDMAGTNPTSFSEGGRKRRIVRPDDTLATIAYEEYGDAKAWRAIALDNDLDGPLSIKPGQVLSIPSRR